MKCRFLNAVTIIVIGFILFQSRVESRILTKIHGNGYFKFCFYYNFSVTLKITKLILKNILVLAAVRRHERLTDDDSHWSPLDCDVGDIIDNLQDVKEEIKEDIFEGLGLSSESESDELDSTSEDESDGESIDSTGINDAGRCFKLNKESRIVMKNLFLKAIATNDPITTDEVNNLTTEKEMDTTPKTSDSTGTDLSAGSTTAASTEANNITTGAAN